MVADNLQPSGKQSEKTEEWPEIYPDYIGVIIPATIAPMNFDYIGGKHDRIDVIVTGSKFEKYT